MNGYLVVQNKIYPIGESNSMPRKGQRTVTLGEGLLETVDKILAQLEKEGILIYRSRTEFITDAIRDKITKMKTTYLLGVHEE